jgi:pimeloyl-ACP methyl ester carboxylesterase
VDGSERYAVLPGAGSAGLPWERIVARLDARLLPLGCEPDVPAMAAALAPAIAALPRPRVVVGASLGAMVALEIARDVPVDGLALIAAGFGVTVAESVLHWVESNPPDLLEKMARAGLGDPSDAELVAVRRRDFATRGQPVLLAHLRALAAHRPQPLPDPPPTLVLRGELDRSVPLADHAELARRLGGALVPIAGAGHAPFLERPEATERWIRRVRTWGAPAPSS